MCGIAGIISLSGGDLERQVEPLISAVAHRGPDDAGTWTDGVCALGHRRLAIIDLSPAGHQPLSTEHRKSWITFNGEIYNFEDLRRRLEGLGHHFRTRTDTEVIVAAYEQWGTDCVSQLRGMFAFAIWDTQRRRLLLARDRVGKKPLFYYQSEDRFVFASELQAVLADAAVPRETDFPSIDAYLTFGYVPAPRTAFKGIAKLAPAHWMTLDVTDNHLDAHVERYWSLAHQPKLAINEADAGAELREKMAESVRLRMISDVPLGAFLSGGIDSSIVVGLMAAISDKPVKTFSIGFEDQAFNELEHARRIAQLWSTDHHEFVVKPNALDVLPRLVRHYGEPYADSSAIPTFYVAQMTREHVTVALNGDGGDESFAGYERYFANRLAQRVQAVPGAAWTGKTLGRLLPDSIDPKNEWRRARRFLRVASQPMAERYGHWVGFFDESAKERLYRPEFMSQLNGNRMSNWLSSLFDQVDGLDPIDAAMSVDIESYLPFDLLVKVDITSMANSLEARSPFLDHEVMEFAARLPVNMKLKGRESKYLLKRVFSDLLPKENVSRRKMGFGVPIGKWFRGPLRDLLCDSLLSSSATSRGYFKSEELSSLVTDHLNLKADHSFQLWNLLMLELWHREFG
jgi:asparagine synthase (glutamine-hydrolysing)